MADGARCASLEVVLDEMEATRHALDLGRAGDVVAVCVDHANEVWKELQRRRHGSDGAAHMRAVTNLPDDGLGAEF